MKQKQYLSTQQGFTLIELLIVIAIIGILASVVLVSLSGAKTKGLIASNESEARQLANLFHLEFSETGSYNALIANAWIGLSYTCSSIPVSGNYAAQYRSICTSINTRLGSDSYNWLVGNGGVNGTFSVMVKTSPAAGTGGDWFCIGSSGKTYRGPYNSSGPGCYYDP